MVTNSLECEVEPDGVGSTAVIDRDVTGDRQDQVALTEDRSRYSRRDHACVAQINIGSPEGAKNFSQTIDGVTLLEPRTRKVAQD